MDNAEWNKRECLENYAGYFLDSLSDEDLERLIEIFADDNTAAMLESELLAHDLDAKHYSSFAEIVTEVKEEMKNEGEEKEPYSEYRESGAKHKLISKLWEEFYK